MTYGEAARFARERAGLTKLGLARKAGVSHATICFIENENRYPRLETAIKIVDALGISLDEYVSHEVKGENDCTNFLD